MLLDSGGEKQMDILFAEGSDKKCVQLLDETMKDLALDELVTRLTTVPEEKSILRAIMSRIPQNPEDIRYRQSIMKDLTEQPELRAALYEALPMIKTMKDHAGTRRAVSDSDNALYTLLSDLRTLSAYVKTVKYLDGELARFELKSPALVKLKNDIHAIMATEDFTTAEEDIAKMLEDLSTVKSAIIGINFAPDLTIESIAAIEFLPYQTASKYKFAQFAAIFGPIIQAGQGAMALTKTLGGRSFNYEDPLLARMAPFIEKHLKRHFTDIKKTMAKYTKMDNRMFTEMYEGLTFYLLCAKFAETLKEQGYETCIPQIEEIPDHSLELQDFYNIRLAILGYKEIVKNDFRFSDEEKLFILTGPNRGGKTILEQGIALISLMASLGLYVTAHSFRGLPFKNILTHFPIDENLTINYGRLGEEAKRVQTIASEADANTLVIFNETYSTTSSTDALYLSQDLLHILKDIGAAVIFNTHIHELARSIPEMNEWEGPGKIVSIVMEIRGDVNTFKLKRSEPDNCSYARNIALKYGITYEQMKEKSHAGAAGATATAK